MKLISCYIENFGNISRREFDFGENLTSLCEKNGYGKTTLAVFLKAMFYGLKATTARDRELGERAHYYPFEGGKFGGNVVFEKGGAVYKIERFFDEKSAVKDKLTVYRGGRELPDPEEVVSGVFGIDAESFQRTVFITSADTETGATADIGRMLNGFADDADFEGAKKLLEDRKKLFKAGRGDKGLIAEKRREIESLENEIKNRQTIDDGLGEKNEKRNALSAEIARLEALRTRQRDRDVLNQKWATYDRYKSDAAEERARLEKLTAGYPAGLPDAESARAFDESVQNLKLAEAGLSSVVFTEEKEKRLGELSSRFKEGVPSEGELKEANASAAELIRVEAEIDGYKSQLDGLKEINFPAGVPDGAEVEKYNKKLEAVREGRAKDNAAKGAGGKKIAFIIAALAVGLFGAGIGLLFVNMIAGIIVIVLSVVEALGFLYFKTLTAKSGAGGGREEDEIASFLARCGYYSGAGVEVDFNNLTRDIKEYNAVKESREGYESALKEKVARLEALRGELLSFLARYGFKGENIQAEIGSLSALTAEYAAANDEKARREARRAQTKSELKKSESFIAEFIKKYALSDGATAVSGDIVRDVAEAERLSKSVNALEKRAESYRLGQSLGERPEADGGESENIDARLSELRRALSQIEMQIGDDEAAVVVLEELKEKRAAAEEEKKELENKHGILMRTLSFLEAAEENLKNRYISPVKEAFLRYGQPLERALGEKVVFDRDFRVRFVRGGEERSDAHLSAGQKSLCALCLRLALIDNMYKGDAPFIIMDDPFVHLDKEHMERAALLLKEISAHKQIIYFCCHESRKI